MSPLAGPFSQRTVKAVIHVLASSGVAVVAGLSGDIPEVPVSGTRSPLRVWGWQARNMAVETADGGGISGAEIDALAPVPHGVLPLSYLVAAYVSSGRTRGARALRDLMGNQDWRHPGQIIFPTLTFALLASDFARSVRPGPSASAFRPPAGLNALLARASGPGLVSGPCSTVGQWVNDTLDLLFSALNKITSALLPAFVANLIGVGLALARGAVAGLISALTAPVADAIRTGVSLLALAFEAASILKPWSLRLRNSPQPNSYSGRPGAVVLTVLDQGPIQWPAVLQDCAKKITGSELPQLRGAANAPVAWQVDGSPDTVQQTALTALDGTTAARQRSLDLATGPDRTAALSYVTSSEPAACAGAAPITTSYVIRAQVTRADAKTVQSLIPDLLGSELAKIPELLRPIFTAAVNDISAKVTAALLAIAGHDTAFALLSIEHHDLAACTSTPSESPSTPLSPPPPVNCHQLPSLGPAGTQIDGRQGPARGFFELICNYATGGGIPYGFIIVETFPTPAAAKAFYDAHVTAPLVPGFSVPVRVSTVCYPDGNCNRDEVALQGYRIDEIAQQSTLPLVRLPPPAQTNTLMLRLLAVT